MSQADVDIIRRLIGALNADDRAGWLELVHPDVVFYGSAEFLETSEVLRGRDQLRRTIDAFVAAFDAFGGSILELVDGGDRVYCLTEWTGVERRSGVPMEFVDPVVWTLSDRLVIGGQVFKDRDAARKAVGLSE